MPFAADLADVTHFGDDVAMDLLHVEVAVAVAEQNAQVRSQRIGSASESGGPLVRLPNASDSERRGRSFVILWRAAGPVERAKPEHGPTGQLWHGWPK